MSKPAYLVALLIFTVFVIASAQVTIVHACQCVSGRTIVQDFQSADTVFSGTALRVENGSLNNYFASLPGVNYSFPVDVVTFNVTHTWKGFNFERAVVLTNQGESACGAHFTIGEAYLVYANGFPEDQLMTNHCNGTMPLALASGQTATLDLLSQGYPSSLIDLIEFGAINFPAITTVTVLGALAVLLWMLIIRKRRAVLKKSALVRYFAILSRNVEACRAYALRGRPADYNDS